ncbi:disease resistance protein RGA2-like [Carex rostrata]
MLDQIQQIRSRFDEITNDRIALQFSEGDGPRHCNNELQIAPMSHFVVESNIFGREKEKEKLIDLLSYECDVVSVVTIVGMGGIGKTTLAQLAYNDQRIRQRFDKFGWICVSEDFNVERLTKETLESITGNGCSLTNLSALQEKIHKEISRKRVLLVLDDVWNEKKSLWDSFRAPFMSATFVKILVTTRNEPVAQIIQTEPTFNLSSLPVQQCWQLFKHYAFGGVEHNKNPKLVEIGKQIMNKCGMLPLAVKSIASLLRHEGEEENWRDILESEIWESDVKSEIFSPLQISYAHLPTHLKSCFLYCSSFPKNYCYHVEYLVKLWMYQGFIECKGNKTAEKIGFEYAQQLCQRTLFEREDIYEGDDFKMFKLHDIFHDLARHNSENACYSIEASKIPIFPNVLYNLYIANYVNVIYPIPSEQFTALRTLIIGFSVKNVLSSFDISMAPKLRSLEITGDHNWKLESLSSVGNLKHLRYLSLSHLFLEMLPECICSLYSLQNLTLKYSRFKELPTKIGNLISLEYMLVHGCFYLALLPESICQLKALKKLCLIDCTLLKELPIDMGSLYNLQTLEIINTGVSCLPPSLSKFVGIKLLKVNLICETIGWLKDFPDLGGSLCLSNLNEISNLRDVQCANLVGMHNLEQLRLSWDRSCWDTRHIDGSVLELIITSGQNIFLERQSSVSVMVCLQPHPNLKKLEIRNYSDIKFPDWIVMAHSGSSRLGLANLTSLTSLKISNCLKLQVLDDELLPVQPCKVEVSKCPELRQWCMQHGINYQISVTRFWLSDPDVPLLKVHSPLVGEKRGMGLRWQQEPEAEGGAAEGQEGAVNDDDSLSPTTETMFRVSPNEEFERLISSWLKGELLGCGSLGRVYEAIDHRGFFFAVKEMLIDQGTNRESIAQLEQELALLSQFEHENIVQYYRSDKEETILYIFLELMTQGNVASLYKKYHLQDTHVSVYTRQILCGLVYLHERNIIHGNIKCANILVHENQSVKLADFGLAEKMIKMNMLKLSETNVYWMAPEVVNPKKAYGLSADIWSLGCTVLEMLTCQIPYPNIEWTHAIIKIGSGEQPLIPNYLSREAQDFIMQCVRVNPDDRPSAVQLLEHPFVKIPQPLCCSPPPSQSSPSQNDDDMLSPTTETMFRVSPNESLREG